MGRNNADFQDQILVHRGLNNVTPELVDTNDIGEFWTTDHKVAEQFARTGEPNAPGVVVSALVSKQHTVPSEWEERKKEWEKDPRSFDAEDDYSGPDPESEVHVYPSSKAKIIGMKTVNPSGVVNPSGTSSTNRVY